MTKLLRVIAHVGPHETVMPLGDVRESMDRKEIPDAPRMLRERALVIAGFVGDCLRPHVVRLSLAGSLRRGTADVGDVDLLIIPKDYEWRTVLRRISGVRILADGGKRVLLALSTGERVDVIATSSESWGAALQYLTGSRWHNISLRQRAIALGLTLNEYGVWRGKERLAGNREGDVYRALGLRWVPPACRQNPVGRGWVRVPSMP